MPASSLEPGDVVDFHLAGGRIARVHAVSDETIVLDVGGELVEGGAALFSETSTRLPTPDLNEIYARRWQDGPQGIREELLALGPLDRLRALARYELTGPARKRGQGAWPSVALRRVEETWRDRVDGDVAWLEEALEALRTAPPLDLRLEPDATSVRIELPSVPALMERLLDPPGVTSWEVEGLTFAATYRPSDRNPALVRVAGERDPYDEGEERLLLEAAHLIRRSRLRELPRDSAGHAVWGRVRTLFFRCFFNALRRRLSSRLIDRCGEWPAKELRDELSRHLSLTNSTVEEVVAATDCAEIAPWLDGDPLTKAEEQRCAEAAAGLIDGPDREPRNVRRMAWASSDLHAPPEASGLELAAELCDELVERLVDPDPSPPAVARLVAALDGASAKKSPSALIHDALLGLVDTPEVMARRVSAEAREASLEDLRVSTAGELHGEGGVADGERRHAPTLERQAFPVRADDPAAKEAFRDLVARADVESADPHDRARRILRAIRIRFARQTLKGFEDVATTEREEKHRKGVRVLQAMHASFLPLGALTRAHDLPRKTASGWGRKGLPPAYLRQCFPPELTEDEELKKGFVQIHGLLKVLNLPDRDELSAVLHADPDDTRLEAFSFLFHHAPVDGDGNWYPSALREAAEALGTDPDLGLTRAVIDVVRRVMELRRARARRKDAAHEPTLAGLDDAQLDALVVELALYGPPDPSALRAALADRDRAALAEEAGLTLSELTDLALGRCWLSDEAAADLRRALGDDGERAVAGLVRRPALGERP